MSLSITCRSCNSRFRAPENAAGKRTRCPKCKSPINIPAIDEKAGLSDSQPGESSSGICKSCRGPLRKVLLKGRPSGQFICCECEVRPGKCPFCYTLLKSHSAQQCLKCGRSWHRSIVEPNRTTSRKESQRDQESEIRQLITPVAASIITQGQAADSNEPGVWSTDVGVDTYDGLRFPSACCACLKYGPDRHLVLKRSDTHVSGSVVRYATTSKVTLMIPICNSCRQEQGALTFDHEVSVLWGTLFLVAYFSFIMWSVAAYCHIPLSNLVVGAASVAIAFFFVIGTCTGLGMGSRSNPNPGGLIKIPFFAAGIRTLGAFFCRRHKKSHGKVAAQWSFGGLEFSNSHYAKAFAAINGKVNPVIKTKKKGPRPTLLPAIIVLLIYGATAAGMSFLMTQGILVERDMELRRHRRISSSSPIEEIYKQAYVPPQAIDFDNHS